MTGRTPPRPYRLRALFLATALLAVFAAAAPLAAQDQPASEPKYVGIPLDEKSTKKDAEQTARVLLKDQIAFHARAAGKDPTLFASFNALNTDSEKGFLLAVLYGPTACATQGCETYVFRNTGGNTWQQVLNTTSDMVWHDRAEKPADIATQGGGAPAVLWRWNGQAYARLR